MAASDVTALMKSPRPQLLIPRPTHPVRGTSLCQADSAGWSTGTGPYWVAAPTTALFRRRDNPDAVALPSHEPRATCVGPSITQRPSARGDLVADYGRRIRCGSPRRSLIPPRQPASSVQTNAQIGRCFGVTHDGRVHWRTAWMTTGEGPRLCSETRVVGRADVSAKATERRRCTRTVISATDRGCGEVGSSACGAGPHASSRGVSPQVCWRCAGLGLGRKVGRCDELCMV
jgi:hypothetical protein